MAGNQQNVLVKLSAEGEEQVVNAFAKMAEGAKKSGAEATGALSAVNETALKLGASLVGLFTLDRIAHGFADLVKGAIESAAGLERLSQRTGATVAGIADLTVVAKLSGTATDQVGTGLQKLSKSMVDAANGGTKTSAAFAAIGISTQDIARQKPDEVFRQIAVQLAKYQDGAEKVAVAQALFGKSGAELLPLLKDLAENADLHSRVTAEEAKQAEEFDKNLTRLSITFHENAAALVREFLPALSALAVNMLAAQKAGAGLLQTLISIPAQNLWAAFAGTPIQERIDSARDSVKKLRDLIAEPAGKTPEFIASLQRELKTYQAQLEGLLAQQRELALQGVGDTGDQVSRRFQTPKPEIKFDLHGPEVARAEEQLTQQKLDNELAAYKANAAEREALDKQAFGEGLLSIEEYFDDRAQVITDRADKEVEILRRKRAAAAALPVDENNQVKAIEQRRELAKLDGQIAVINSATERELATNETERDAAKLRNLAAEQKAEEALAKLRGDHLAAQRAQLDRNLQELDRTLAAGGVSPGARTSAVDTARAQGTAVIDFGEAARTAKQQFTDLTLAIDKVKQAQASGELFPIQAEQQIVEIERQRIPQLQAIADEMTRQAELSHDPVLIEQAKQGQEKMVALKVATNDAGDQLKKLKDIAQATFVDGLSNAIVETINNTKKAGDAFRAFGLQLAQAIEQAVAKMLVLKAVQAVVGFGGGGTVAPGQSPPANVFAAGGAVSGQGSGDTVPAWLTPGEFVVHKDAASQPGMRQLLEAINGGALRGKATAGAQHFAAGGLVATGAAAGPQIKVVNVLDPSLLGDHLATAPGEQSVINIMARHPGRIREALGS